MANVSSSNGLEKRPKLRFPGFDEPWKVFKAEELFQNVTDKNHPDETVLTIIQGKGTLPREQAGRNIHYDDASLSNYKKVEQGDFIIHLRSFEGGLEMANEAGIVSPAYTILRCKRPHSSLFYDAYFHTDEFINHNLSKSVEGIRDGRQISYEAFKWLGIPYCEPTEQEKISNLFSVLNERIAKQRDLVESLKKYKRGLLYTIEAGFQDCVQYTRLGELFSVQGGFAFKSEFFGGSGNTVIRISDINNGIVSTQNAVSYPLSIKIDERFIVQKGDLLIAMSGATTGKTGIYNENKKSYLNQRVGKFVCKSETYSLEYLSEILESSSFSKSLKNLLIAGAQPNISPSDIESIPIPIFNKDVSKHITGLLHKYSLLILQEEKLLASLLQMRKGVAQQLFI